MNERPLLHSEGLFFCPQALHPPKPFLAFEAHTGARTNTKPGQQKFTFCQYQEMRPPWS